MCVCVCVSPGGVGGGRGHMLVVACDTFVHIYTHAQIPFQDGASSRRFRPLKRSLSSPVAPTARVCVCVSVCVCA